MNPASTSRAKSGIGNSSAPIWPTIRRLSQARVWRRPDQDGREWKPGKAVALLPDHEGRKQRDKEAVRKVGVVPPLSDEVSKGGPVEPEREAPECRVAREGQRAKGLSSGAQSKVRFALVGSRSRAEKPFGKSFRISERIRVRNANPRSERLASAAPNSSRMRVSRGESFEGRNRSLERWHIRGNRRSYITGSEGSLQPIAMGSQK